MSTAIIHAVSQMPAHLSARTGSDMSLNAAAEEFASIRFPVISVKNSRFHIKRDGEKTQIMRPKSNPSDPDEPATYIDVVILNIQKCKTYYADGYTDGSEDKPTCFSNDALTPDASGLAPQSSTCALCPHNAWGSGTNDKGEATKGKACSDTQRLAVAGVDAMDDPFMLRIPPASLKNLAELSRTLTNRNAPLNGAVTRISFDSEALGVVLTFKLAGWLDAERYAKAQSKLNDDLVLSIIGRNSVATGAPVVAAPVVAAPVVAAPVVAAPVVAAPVVAAPVVAAPVVVDLAAAKRAEAKEKKLAAARALLAEAEADDGAEAAPDAEAPSSAPATTSVVSSDKFAADLAALLA